MALLFGGLCILYGLFALLLIKPWNGPSGFDFYYYALQVKALDATGILLFRDFSPVYYVSYLINLLARDPVVAVQVTTIFSGLLCLGGLLMLVITQGDAQDPGDGLIGRLALLFFGIVNPLFFFLYWEFIKNLFALGVFLIGFSCLQVSSGFLAEQRGRNVLYKILGLLLLILAGLSHRLIAVVILLLAVQYGLKSLSGRIRSKKILFFLFGTAFLLILLGGMASWNLWNDRLSSFSLKAPVQRLTLMTRKNLDVVQIVSFLSIQILIPFSCIGLFIKRKSLDWGALLFQPRVLFFLLAQMMVFPFLSFGWDDIGFRLFILSPLFFSLWLLLSKRRIPRILTGFLYASVGIFAIQGLVSNQFERGPDYRTMGRDLQGVEFYMEGKKLICHRGLAGYMWYEKGIWTENFRPADGAEEEYYRFVYGFRSETFTPYLQDEELPGFSSGSYTLVQETVWKRFYERNRGLYFLQSELNPYLPRPSTGFAIRQEAAAALSKGE